MQIAVVITNQNTRQSLHCTMYSTGLNEITQHLQPMQLALRSHEREEDRNEFIGGAKHTDNSQVHDLRPNTLHGINKHIISLAVSIASQRPGKTARAEQLT